MRISILSLFLCSVFAAAQSDDSTVQKLLDRKVSVEIYPSQDEFLAVCRTVQLPCGEEVMPNETFSHGHEFWDGITLRAALEKIVARRPNFMWEIGDGTLVLRPRTTASKPLEKKIRRFSQKARPLSEVLSDLAHSESINIPKPAVFEMPGDINAFHASYLKPIDIHCENVTLREVLNKAVQAHGHAMWEYTYATPSIFVPNFLRRGTLASFVY